MRKVVIGKKEKERATEEARRGKGEGRKAEKGGEEKDHGWLKVNAGKPLLS